LGWTLAVSIEGACVGLVLGLRDGVLPAPCANSRPRRRSRCEGADRNWMAHRHRVIPTERVTPFAPHFFVEN
jgi:hypothetical protein